MRVRELVGSLRNTLPALMQQQITAQMKQMQQNNPALASLTEQQQAISKFTTNLWSGHRIYTNPTR
jgi:hypothetical protein